MFSVTLEQLRKHGACVDGYNKVVSALHEIEYSDLECTYIKSEHNTPIQLTDIMKSNGIVDAAWALRCLDNEYDVRMFNIWYTRYLYKDVSSEKYINLLNSAEDYANGVMSRCDYEDLLSQTYDEIKDFVYSEHYIREAVSLRPAYLMCFQTMFVFGANSLHILNDMFTKMCNNQAHWQLINRTV